MNMMNALMGKAAFSSVHSAVILAILVCCSLVSLALILERWLYFRKIEINSDEALQRVRDSLLAGKIPEALQMLGDVKNNPVLELIQMGIKSSRLAKDQVGEMMRLCQARHRAGLERNLGILGTLGNVAPFIGLLGTVLGIIQAFQDLAGPSAQASGASVVAVGIAEALVATAAGLVVAIPAVVFYNHFLRKAKNVLTQMEVAGMELLLLLSMKDAEGSQNGAIQ
jgi:biopolymer transport protein ExbB